MRHVALLGDPKLENAPRATATPDIVRRAHQWASIRVMATPADIDGSKRCHIALQFRRVPEDEGAPGFRGWQQRRAATLAISSLRVRFNAEARVSASSF